MISVLAALLMQAAPIAAPAPSVITQPDWAALPTGADFAALYPKEAAARNVEGRAVLACAVGADGLLVNCSIPEEDPADMGFGAAALAMSSLFKMRPMSKDGYPVGGGQVRIPIRFRLPPPEPPSAGSQQRAAGTASFALTTTGPKAIKWLEKPDYQTMSMAMVRYSSVRDGRVVLFCQVAASGRFEGCRVESETPAKVGLGNAALSLAYAFRMAPITADGGSVAGGTLSIPLHFFSPP